MIKQTRIYIVLLVAIFLCSFVSLQTSFASDYCRAGCSLEYKKCRKACDGDTDCLLDCSDSKSECIENCN